MEKEKLNTWDECIICLYNLMKTSPEHGNAMNDILDGDCFKPSIRYRFFNNAYSNAFKECEEKINEFAAIDEEHHDIMAFVLEKAESYDIIGIYYTCISEKLDN